MITDPKSKANKTKIKNQQFPKLRKQKKMKFATCEHCEILMCIDCYLTCDCGNISCLDCGYQCTDCGYIACEECIVFSHGCFICSHCLVGENITEK